MTKFVIRSMTTTDFDIVQGIKAEPYHIYLLPVHQRTGAYWSACGGQEFDTAEEAFAEIARALPDRGSLYGNRPQVVPVNAEALGIAPYWAPSVMV